MAAEAAQEAKRLEEDCAAELGALSAGASERFINSLPFSLGDILPTLHAAISALDKLTPQEISEVRKYISPPEVRLIRHLGIAPV